MLFSSDQCVLVVIDVQGKLALEVFEHEKTLGNIIRLIFFSKLLSIPILWTEQLPEKIGPTEATVSSLLLPDVKPIKKSSFNCAREPQFLQNLKDLKKPEVILCGIEAHVCVFQTAMSLIEHNFKIQVVSDAISSRTRENKEAAIKRLEAYHTDITCVEMLATELLQDAKHPRFKDVLKLIK